MRYVELFCGCGGFASGAAAAGWKNEGAFDVDEYSLSIYAENFPAHPIERRDLAHALSPELIRRCKGVDCIVGGAPCQDFSTAGTEEKRRKGERASLTLAFADHVDALRPEFVVFENVRAAAKRSQFLAFCERLHAMGYHFAYRPVDCTTLGMAQKRHRLILVAHRDGMEKVDAMWRHFDTTFATRGPATMRSVFESHALPMPAENVYYPKPQALAVQPEVFSLDTPSPTIRGRTRPIPPAYRSSVQDSTQDLDDVFALTSDHISALQGFPKEFRWLGCATKRNTCIGNAIPPPLAYALATSISHAIKQSARRKRGRR